MDRSIIWYTDNRLREPIFSVCQSQISRATNLPVVSVSLKPVNFGRNIVLDLQPNIITMYKQILTALENSTSDVVFFCEHDVLYHPSHFDFMPDQDDVFYYNTNVWRWRYPEDFAITYEVIASLSALCCNRELAVKQYRLRLDKVRENNWGIGDGHEPHWCRRIGHEPGTKRRRNGGLTNDKHITWKSSYPNIDLRHGSTFSKTKCSLAEFTHPPSLETWKETTLDKISGWTNLRGMFGL